MRERNHVRLLVLGRNGLVLLAVLTASSLSSAARGQGPGLFKDGQRILEFEQTSDFTYLAKDLPSDVRAKLDGSPFAKMLPARPASELCRLGKPGRGLRPKQVEKRIAVVQ